MIISLRGTNGAGKSTLVRQIMAVYEPRSIWIEGKRRPIGTVLTSAKKRPLFVPGHYEIANGGIDTLGSLDEAYALIRTYSEEYDVLYEGKNMSDGVSRISTFDKNDVVILQLITPLEECVQGVRNRGHSIQRKTIEKLWNKTESDCQRLEQAGYRVERRTRGQAVSYLLNLLEDNHENR